MGNNHHISYDLKDAAYNESDVSKYHLSLELDANSLRYAVFDLKKYKYILFKEYQLNDDLGLRLSELESIFISDSLLQDNFYTKSFTLNINGSVIIPNSLFDFSQREKILALSENFVPDKDVIINESIKNLDSTLLYSIDARLYNIIKNSATKDFLLIHQHNVLINSLISKYKNNFSGYKLCINFRRNHIDILLFKAQDLLIANYFKHNSVNDIVYYVNYLIDIFKLNQADFDLVMLGEIDKRSMIYDKLKIYVKEISFCSRNESFNYSYIFDDFGENMYYVLLNSYQCV